MSDQTEYAVMCDGYDGARIHEHGPVDREVADHWLRTIDASRLCGPHRVVQRTVTDWQPLAPVSSEGGER